MKYYLIAGEASGDLHASNLMSGIKKMDKNASFRFFGGDLMQKQDGVLVKHYKDLAFMGIWEVVKNIGIILKNMSLCKKDILKWKPDVIILIDYPAFNLRISKFASKNGFKVFYYISPKVWVWKKKRIKKIKRFVNKMYVIFPFEVDFYKKHNFKVEYFGNPTVDLVEIEKNKEINIKNILSEKNNSKIVALLPGSRQQEIEKILPVMINIAKIFSGYVFVIAGVSSIGKTKYEPFLKSNNIKIVFDKTFELLKLSYAAVVTSGTATLETALFKVPQVVCYKTSNFSYTIGKMIVNIDYFSLVNIIMKEEIVKEFLQKDLKKDIKLELKRLLMDDDYRKKMLYNYKKLNEKLGKPGCSTRIAENMYENLKK